MNRKQRLIDYITVAARKAEEAGRLDLAADLREDIVHLQSSRS